MNSLRCGSREISRRVGLWIALAVCVAAVLGLFIVRMSQLSRSGEATDLPEVAQSDLEFIGGRWWFRETTNAFTGWLVERYGSGALRARSCVSNGWLEGVSEGWHTNGQMQVREHYLAGVAHGQRLKWDLAGRRVSEAEIVHGKLHGTFRRWHTNGIVAEEMEMKDGEPEGVARAYFPDGSLKAEVCMSKGKILAQKHLADAPAQGGDRP